MKQLPWSSANVPALPDAIWDEARKLVLIRLSFLKPDVPSTHWETMIREGDRIMVDSIVEIGVELATQAKVKVVPLRTMAMIQENAHLLYMRDVQKRKIEQYNEAAASA